MIDAYFNLPAYGIERYQPHSQLFTLPLEELERLWIGECRFIEIDVFEECDYAGSVQLEAKGWRFVGIYLHIILAKIYNVSEAVVMDATEIDFPWPFY